MIEVISDRVYRICMFFLVPLALVHLAFPGRDPLKRKVRAIQVQKPSLTPVYLGLMLGKKPYRVEISPIRPKPHRAEVSSERPEPHRRHSFAR